MCLQNDASETNGGSGKTSQLQKIAHQSEGSEFEYFQQNLLQPFLVTRVPDTDGNRRVQQACAIVISTGFPRLLESPGFFFLKIPGPGKSWRITFVLKSPGN